MDTDSAAPRSLRRNEAVLVGPGFEATAPYRKTLLVPFVEELPLAGRVRWPAWLSRGGFGIDRGDGPQSFTLPDGTRFTAVICWENLFSGYVRRAVSDGARLLVVLTNDAWGGRSAAAHGHNAVSVLRAVETGLPVLVASNAGPSLGIDRRGRVIARPRGVFTHEVVTAAVKPGTATPYARGGGLLPQLSFSRQPHFSRQRRRGLCLPGARNPHCSRANDPGSSPDAAASLAGGPAGPAWTAGSSPASYR